MTLSNLIYFYHNRYCSHESKNESCPCCSIEFSEWILQIPMAAHPSSKIVCSHTGSVLDDDNHPIALPNGNVYSKEAIAELTSANGITDPQTQAVFEAASLRHVYIT